MGVRCLNSLVNIFVVQNANKKMKKKNIKKYKSKQQQLQNQLQQKRKNRERIKRNYSSLVPWHMQIFGGVFRVSQALWPLLFVDVGAINSSHVKGKVCNNKSIKLPSSASNENQPQSHFPNSAASWFRVSPLIRFSHCLYLCIYLCWRGGMITI